MLIRSPVLTHFAAASLLALAACGGGQPEDQAGQDEDPAYAHALAGPLMTDPDLASRNRAYSAIAGGGPGIVEVPPIEDGPEAITAARDEATKLVGGKIEAAPFPVEGSNPVLRDAVTAAQRGAAIKGPGSNCPAKASYAMGWSLQLPAPFPIYPRGHLLEAAGSDSDGCRLRVVRFVTPVEPGDLIDFYHTRAKAAHFDVRRMAADGAQVLEGSKGVAAYAVQARKRKDGLTEADIVVNGG